MIGYLKMPTNAEKRRIREQYGIPTQNVSRYIRTYFGFTPAEFYRQVLRDEAIQEFQERRAVRALAERRRRERAVGALQRGARSFMDRVRVGRINNVVNLTTDQTYEPPHVTHRSLLERFMGRQVQVVTTMYNANGTVNTSVKRISIPATNYSTWWNQYGWWNFIVDSDTTVLDKLAEKGDGRLYATITLTPIKYITRSRHPQLFLDGVTHCMFTPIFDWAKDKQINSKSKSASKKYSAIVKKVSKYNKQYEAGVPEADIQNICNDLQIDIKIDIPLIENKFIDCKSFKKPLKTFKFVNSRLNHIELNEVVHTNKYEEVTQEQLDALANYLRDNDKYFDFQKNSSGKYTSIRTLTGCYRSASKYQQAVNDFEDITNMADNKIDVLNDDCYDMIEEGLVPNGTIDFEKRWLLKWWGKREDTEGREWRERKVKKLIANGEEVPVKPDIGHIDMKKAYANFQDCEQYMGFMGKPTDWRYCDVDIDFIKKNPGIYRLAELDLDNCPDKVVDIISKLKLYNIEDAYPSSDFLWLHENGAKFKVSEGCWGTKIDFRFTPRMFDKEDGVSYYSKWCGVQQKYSRTQSYGIYGDEEFFENIKEYAPEDCEIGCYRKGEGQVIYPKSHSFTAPHIVAFIMSYQRLTVFNQLKLMDLDKLLRICVDGIYYRKHTFDILDNFQIKDEIKLGNDGSSRYMWQDRYMDLADRPKKPAPFREQYDTELFIGAGGNGKTHYNLTDKGLARLMYVAPSWKLARAKSLEYGVNTTVIARCLHETYKKDIKKYNNVLLFDEASMISQETKEALFELYGCCKLIFCGDIGYQLPPIKGDAMSNIWFDNITEFKQNYRFTCDKHKKICENVRMMMRQDWKKADINEYVCRSYQQVDEDYVKDNYNTKDIILCSTHNICDKYTNMFGATKFKCKENLRDYSNGDILIADKAPEGDWEVRHGYTIHSVQGETYEETIYIDSNRLFDSRMAYTAISRARRWEQIKIIV